MSERMNERLNVLCAAGELSRALLHVRAPDWANDEAQTPEDKPQVQRYRCYNISHSLHPLVQVFLVKAGKSM